MDGGAPVVMGKGSAIRPNIWGTERVDLANAPANWVRNDVLTNAQSEYRAKPNRQGVVWGNHQASLMLYGALRNLGADVVPFNSVRLTLGMARRASDMLAESELETARELGDALRNASEDAMRQGWHSVIFVDSTRLGNMGQPSLRAVIATTHRFRRSEEAKVSPSPKPIAKDVQQALPVVDKPSSVFMTAIKLILRISWKIIAPFVALSLAIGVKYAAEHHSVEFYFISTLFWFLCSAPLLWLLYKMVTDPTYQSEKDYRKGLIFLILLTLSGLSFSVLGAYFWWTSQ